MANFVLEIAELSRVELCRVADSINFPDEEERVLNYWKGENVFEKCMEQSKNRPKYNFYDGPPFATGLPHYGHILAGTIKDIITRYAYQQGYHVERRFGWDCHGLPVEFEIDKQLNIKSPRDVEEMGIATYNAACRKIVMRYANEWQEIITRMGRWVDFSNDYKTLYPWYMESIWWVFKQLYDKGFVYEGVKVMPYSTACTTPLSNFESGQNYKEVIDPCVVIALQLVNDSKTFLLIWTTTPWTLPSNYACCVNPNMDYVKVLYLSDQRQFILAESRLSYVFKSEDEYKIIERFKGKHLEGLSYKPLFPYFEKRGLADNAFRVLVDDYVTEDSGTGVVHNAPYFGEDDYRVCLNNNIISKNSKIICPIDETGCFTEEVPDFAGLYVKVADKRIIEWFKERNQLFSVNQVKHQYPYCWRSDTPLIYKAVPSWFIRVEHMSEQLLNCSSTSYWVPEFVKEKRFGNWLKDARDWAVSRNRYWGTPIPIWTNGEEYVCVGSIDELKKLSGIKVSDLHRENIDHIEIASIKKNGKPLKRISAVFDCWFESGSMPFAQQHYPFENERSFLQNFPADFIAEGIDQTRGWFYTLLVISTALFNKAPYKNLIANGLILASDGQKMSKRKKNYPDPMEIVHKYGADALRLYLINSPVVRAENLRFKEEGVRDIIKDVFLPWYNAFRFLLQNIARYEKEEENVGVYTYLLDRHLNNINDAAVMDVWIFSFKESLIKFFCNEMKQYHLYTVVPRLTKFIDQLTNWYVRLNRRRIKGEFGKSECLQSLDTLYDVLFTLVKLMAPFTPFLSEHIYQRLVVFQPEYLKISKSVHFQMIPKFDECRIRPDIEKSVALMQTVIELGRIMRDRRTWPIKYPVREIIVIHQNTDILQKIEQMQPFILAELNVMKITLSNDRKKYGITMRAEPDHKILGQRLKSAFKSIMSKLKSLNNTEIMEYLRQGHFMIEGERIELSEVRIIYQVDKDLQDSFEAHSDNEILVLMDMSQDDELIEQGLAREIINRIQKLKKKANLIPTDQVIILYDLLDNDQQLINVFNKHENIISQAVKSAIKQSSEELKNLKQLIKEVVEIKQTKFALTILSECQQVSSMLGNAKWINIVLANDIEPRFNGGLQASLLLEKSNKKLQFRDLHLEIENLFGLYGRKYTTHFLKNNVWEILENLEQLNNGALVSVTLEQTKKIDVDSKFLNWNEPYCAFKSENNYIRFIENPLGIKELCRSK